MKEEADFTDTVMHIEKDADGRSGAMTDQK